MAKLLEGKVAVVTGSGRGIGRGIALALGQEGAKVVVNDIGCATDGRGTDADPAAVVCKEIAALGTEAVPSYDSVADYESAGRIIKTALDAFGRCDILVNNAGILRDKQLLNMTPDDFDAVLKVHLYGGFNCCRHALPVMREQGYGRIIMTTSGSGLFGNFGQANYAAAKMGLVGLMNVLAIEGARNDIRVNAISPIARTRMTADTMSEMVKDLEPAQVTPVVVYLAHHTCTRTAHIYRVGGTHVSRVFIAETPGITVRGGPVG